MFYCLGFILYFIGITAGLPQSTALGMLIAFEAACFYATYNKFGDVPQGWAEFNNGGFTKLNLAMVPNAYKFVSFAPHEDGL